MTHIITSNPLCGITSINKVGTKFLICDSRKEEIPPLAEESLHQTVYLSNLTNYGYNNGYDGISYHDYSIVYSIDEVIQSIAQVISSDEQRLIDAASSDDPNDVEDIKVYIAIDHSISSQFKNKLNHCLNDLHSGVCSQDLFQVLRLTRNSELVMTTSNLIGVTSDVLHPEDPVCFGYGLMEAFG